MLQKKSLADPNFRNIAGVAVALIICIAFLMSGGVSQAEEEPALWLKDVLKRSTGETMPPLQLKFFKRAGPEPYKQSKIEFMEVGEFEFMEVSEFDLPGPHVDPYDGLTKRVGKTGSLKEIMCAKRPRLLPPEECLFEGK